MKFIVRTIGVLLFIGLLLYCWNRYHYDWQYRNQLNDFTAENLPYKFDDGRLSTDTSTPLAVSNLSNSDSLIIENNSLRTEQSLNGVWDVEEGDWDKPPLKFQHKVPVPGTMEMATPAFKFPFVEHKQYTFFDFVKEYLIPTRIPVPTIIDENREAFWYHKKFVSTIDQADVIYLKINKAKYHTTVWLNGQLIGENPHNFTPGYFDLSKIIKPNEENELLIRVGSSMSGYEGKGTYLDGFDMEKSRFYPGIYDDVNLIGYGSSRVKNIKIVPKPNENKVGVAVWLENHSNANRQESIRFKIMNYEQPDSILYAGTTSTIDLPGNSVQQYYLEVEGIDLKAWSPENPNLYRLAISTSNDEMSSRFGMRTFYFDSETKLPTLNGQTRFLRGSNVCFFRMLEDPTLQDEPWNEDWVRKFFSRCKYMQWNVLRICIGPVPEFWYKIADEEGIMLVDEAPIWTMQRELNTTAEILVYEYLAQLEHHWNYPSIIMWDAQNETLLNPPTLMALRTVRGVDLSNRPWDNGWDYPDLDTDPYEEHVYPHENFHTGKGKLFNVSEFKDIDYNIYFHRKMKHKDNPLIINEYAWLWLQRDGTPTELTKKGYDLFLPNSTAEERFEFWNYRMAAMTETMRARRIAGVMHFCALGHSYDGCYTTDNFTDLQSLEFESHFDKYQKSSFSPLGICIWDFKEQVSPQSEEEIIVRVYNDDNEPWNGVVNLNLVVDDKTITTLSSNAVELAIAEMKEISFKLNISEISNSSAIVASIQDNKGNVVKSLRKLTIEHE